MADKLGVSVNCVIKAIYDKSIAADFKKLILTKIKEGINKSSKLEVDEKPVKGFALNSILELNKDEKLKSLQLKGSISIAIMGVGMAAVTINLKPNGPSAADAGRDQKSDAAQAKVLVESILENLVPKAVKQMESRVP